MKVNTISLNNVYNANSAKISFKDNQINDTAKQTQTVDITQFKAGKPVEIKTSFISKMLNKLKSFFKSSYEAMYSADESDLDQYIAERIYLYV